MPTSHGSEKILWKSCKEGITPELVDDASDPRLNQHRLPGKRTGLIVGALPSHDSFVRNFWALYFEAHHAAEQGPYDLPWL